MAYEDTDNPLASPFSFSIESTSSGNAELLEGLFAPESSTSPDDVQVIQKDKQQPPKKDAAPVKPEAKKKDEEEPKDEKKDENPINTRFGDDEDKDKDDEGEPKGDDTDDEGKVDEINQFQALSKDLFKLGVFSKDEDESEDGITTAEQFLDRFTYEKKKGANEIVSNFIGQFGEDYQEAFEAIYVKGVDPK